MDKNIPLSELIRQGSKVTGMCANRLAIVDQNKTCAIGAAYLARTGEFPSLQGDGKRTSSELALQACGVDPYAEVHASGSKIPLVDYILNLNDCTSLTREDIAGRLEALGL